MDSFKRKQLILSKREVLLKLNLGVSLDLSLEERKERKHLFEVKDKLKVMGVTTTLKSNRLYLDNKPLTLQDIEILLDMPDKDQSDGGEKSETATPRSLKRKLNFQALYIQAASKSVKVSK